MDNEVSPTNDMFAAFNPLVKELIFAFNASVAVILPAIHSIMRAYEPIVIAQQAEGRRLIQKHRHRRKL